MRPRKIKKANARLLILPIEKTKYKDNAENQAGKMSKREEKKGGQLLFAQERKEATNVGERELVDICFCVCVCVCRGSGRIVCVVGLRKSHPRGKKKPKMLKAPNAMHVVCVSCSVIRRP